jgi:hypothetical protein
MLSQRIGWFIPPLDTPGPVRVRMPMSARLARVVHERSQDRADGSQASSTGVTLEPITGRVRLHALPRSAVVLLWHARTWRVLPLLAARQIPFFIIDPALYASTEEAEWLALYARYARPAHPAMLRASSEANFARLTATVPRGARVHVCGNGPGLQRIFETSCRGDLTIICNSAVRSDRLLAHLRPTIIAFVNSPYFGPSEHARDHAARLVRCIEEYGSFIAIPEGYAHHLLRTHHPRLAAHIVALQFGRTMTTPKAGDLSAQASANVLTCLMLPLAGALGPREIRVWGCDGQPASRRGAWTYLPGLEAGVTSVASEHPAFVEGLPHSDQDWRRIYDAHAEHLERVLLYLERHGVPIVCASPSVMPALARRTSA